MHDGEIGTCSLDRNGWIVYQLRVIVHATQLGDSTFSCREPDTEWLLAELEKAGAL